MANRVKEYKPSEVERVFCEQSRLAIAKYRAENPEVNPSDAIDAALGLGATLYRAIEAEAARRAMSASSTILNPAVETDDAEIIALRSAFAQAAFALVRAIVPNVPIGAIVTPKLEIIAGDGIVLPADKACGARLLLNVRKPKGEASADDAEASPEA